MRCMTARQGQRAKHVTVRNVPPELAEALQAERKRLGTSINQVVIELLRQALGLGPGQVRSNRLAELAGTWTQEELEEFEAAVAPPTE